LARAIGQKMSLSMGVPVVVDNRAGASAAIGTEVLAKSRPDGYTIMMGYRETSQRLRTWATFR